VLDVGAFSPPSVEKVLLGGAGEDKGERGLDRAEIKGEHESGGGGFLAGEKTR